MNEALIKKYKAQARKMTNAQRKKIINEYAPLVKFVANRIAARLPANIEYDDLMSAGLIGLMDAIEKYDPSRDNKFKTYAEFRIRGAILDELRTQDWVPRSMRDKTKLIEKAISRLEQKLGRVPTEGEVAQELNMSLEEYQEALHECKSLSLVSIEEVGAFANGDRKSLLNVLDAGKSENPLFKLAHAQMKEVLTQAISELPEKYRMVLSLYYFDDLNLKEIGEVLEVTESRVSQIHTQAVLRLRARLLADFPEIDESTG